MNFTTHNTNPAIRMKANGTCLQGEITATHAELISLFGKPTEGDGHKVDAEWYIQFEDDTFATVYNWKDGKNYNGESGTPTEQITDWHVGGDHKRCVDKVQIALDLMREGKAEAEPKGKFEEAFSSAQEIMETIKSKHGQLYADAVEVALLTRKRIDLFQMLLTSLVDTEIMPPEAAKAISKIDSEIAARILAKSARHAGIAVKGKEGADEMMAWADKLMAAERSGAEALFKDVLKDDK
jgi:hypothetical protein